MDFVCLGNSGLKVSRLCLGCMSYGSSKARAWILDEEAALPFYQQAIEAGINFFDTADLYSQGMSEEITGRALKKLAVRREQVVIATKIFYPTGTSPNERGTSKKHVRHAIDASLQRLGLDYLDLYQIHRYDRSTPMEETLEALTDLIRQGKVLYLRASSMAAWEFAKFFSVAKASSAKAKLCAEKRMPRLNGCTTKRAITRSSIVSLIWPRNAALATPRLRWPGCYTSRELRLLLSEQLNHIICRKRRKHSRFN